MRRSTLVLAAVLMAVLTSSSSAAPNCMPAGATFIAKSAQAEVYSLVPKRKGAITRGYFGCVPGRKPVVLIQDITPKSPTQAAYSSSMFRVGGTWVAWVQRVSSGGQSSVAIHVRSLVGAKRTVEIFTQSGADTAGTVAELKVGSDGALAWALSAAASYVEIDGVAATATQPTPLAFARGIRKDSVRLGGGKVTWVQGGRTRSALLTPQPAPLSGRTAGPQGLDGRFGDCGTLVSGEIKSSGAQAERLARAADGSLVAAGTTESGKGSVDFADTLVVARFSAAGVFDKAFGSHGVAQTRLPRPQGAEDAAVTGVVVESDGRVVVALNTGLRAKTDAAEPMLVRYDATGKLDPTFGTGGIVRHAVGAAASASIAGLAAAPDGGLIAAGTRDDRWFVARFDANGKPDPGFGAGGLVTGTGTDDSAARALVVGADGTIAIGGAVGLDVLFARFDAHGKPLGAATAGSPPGASGIDALALLPDGSYVAAGDVSNVAQQAAVFLGRYDAKGALVPSFGRGGFAVDPQATAPRAVVATGDGRFVVAASFSVGPRTGGDGIVGYSADGSRDASFGYRGAVGGTTSYGLVDWDLLAGDNGTVLAAQKNGQAFAISRFAVGDPAVAATAKEPSVCAMLISATGPGQLAASGRLPVGLRLRKPGPLHLHATATVGGKTVVLGDATSVRPTDEAAVVTIRMTKAGRALLRTATKARIAIAGGAPGAPARHYSVTVG